VTAPLEALPPLPSVFRPVMLREGGDAFARALELAPEEGPLAPSRGAGTLVWVRAYARCEAAVVLEPEQPLGPACIAFQVAANALADALAALAPPELPIRLRWPGTLMVNAGVCGELRLRAAPGSVPGAVPAWLVLGFEARLAWPEGTEPGTQLGQTSLNEEGFVDLTPALLVHGWARHLMAGLDEWQARGARRVAERFLARLEDFSDSAGVKRGIDPASGALVLDRAGHRERRELL
jgi:hypothetical protein